MEVVSAYNATSKTKRQQSTNYILFDSDSFPIMVDNGASYSISNDLRDFVAPPTKLGPKIQGFVGSSTASLIGTVEWHIQCDNGMVHTITLPNTSYVPQASYGCYHHNTGHKQPMISEVHCALHMVTVSC